MHLDHPGTVVQVFISMQNLLRIDAAVLIGLEYATFNNMQLWLESAYCDFNSYV